VGGLGVKYVARERRTSALWVFGCSIAASILVIHPLGITGLKVQLGISWYDAYRIDLIYWIGDLLKTTVVALVAAEVHRAFPHLLRRRRR